MRVLSDLLDRRIESYNILVELSIKEYLQFAVKAIDQNEYQRRKVIKGKIREILKEDLLQGCVIPSIVLATYGKSVQDHDFNKIPSKGLSIINDAISNNEILIIDGLQRTYVMLALKEELEQKQEFYSLTSFLDQVIRAEVYIGLKRMGLLYRMITLNTGQTTMSTRHLMEILYHDFSDITLKDENIKLISEKQGIVTNHDTTEYNFKDMLDGFNSLLERDEGLINRTEILDNIKTLDVLKDEVSAEKDLFKEFIVSFKSFLDQLLAKTNFWKFDKIYFEESGIEIKSAPFGRDVIDIFKKSQVLTGYGAATGHLRKSGQIQLSTLNKLFEQLKTEDDNWAYTIASIVAHLDLISSKSKKIGNDQRYYFNMFFRALLAKDSDQLLNVYKAADYASNRTREDRLTK
jgi:hypothetical protein